MWGSKPQEAPRNFLLAAEYMCDIFSGQKLGTASHHDLSVGATDQVVFLVLLWFEIRTKEGST